MHQLPQLAYSYDALEPFIDAQTMEIHYTKHHQTYVDKLNEALKEYPKLMDKPINELLADFDIVPDAIKKTVRNHGGGHSNHSFFWQILAKNDGTEPTGSLAEAINQTFTDFNTFKTEFTQAATGLFGSGWAWLVKDHDGELKIVTTNNQDSPLLQNYQPIIGLDVWEHAYYLKYRNKRADYIEAWWNVINWQQAEKNFNE